ncbi:MAG: sulfotransferase [Armatimonadetes bacterium]|jgi:hypothetical protein|nr:sulfotransferase [Armatimonadota bacterium]
MLSATSTTRVCHTEAEPFHAAALFTTALAPRNHVGVVWAAERRSLLARLWPGAAGAPAEAPYPGDGPPVFLSGCNRGGTSILSLLLGQHPELHNIGRGRHHEGQWIWNKRFYDWSHHRWAVEPWVRRMRKTSDDATPRLVAYFRRAFAAACPSGRLLEKTPANAVRIPFIDRLYPDCYVIHVLRDGRHTAASLIARGVKMPYAPQQWVGVHSIALPDLERLGPARGLLVRYEELLASPLELLLRICRHCGLDEGPAAREALATAIERHLEVPCDRWGALSSTERQRILAIIGDLQQALGYPVEE